MRNLLLVFASTLLLAGISCKKDKDDNPDPNDRNQWDGRYRMEGTMTDHVNPDYRWKDDTYEYKMHTSGANTDSLTADALGFPGIVIANISSATYFSKFGLVFTFDAATNKVTAVTNYYGQPSSNGRSAVLDPTGVNAIDPVTKNIQVKFFMNETGVVGPRHTYDVTLVYLGARP